MIGREAREQVLAAEGRLPDAVDRLRRRRLERDRHVRRLPRRPGRPARRRRGGGRRQPRHRPAGVLHGARSSVLADDDGQIADAHSISAGLDYPGVGPEHAALRDTGRAEYLAATDEEALAAFHRLAETEGSSRRSSPRTHSPARSSSTASSSSSASPAEATRTSTEVTGPR